MHSLDILDHPDILHCVPISKTLIKFAFWSVLMLMNVQYGVKSVVYFSMPQHPTPLILL